MCAQEGTKRGTKLDSEKPDGLTSGCRRQVRKAAAGRRGRLPTADAETKRNDGRGGSRGCRYTASTTFVSRMIAVRRLDSACSIRTRVCWRDRDMRVVIAATLKPAMGMP